MVEGLLGINILSRLSNHSIFHNQKAVYTLRALGYLEQYRQMRRWLLMLQSLTNIMDGTIAFSETNTENMHRDTN